jgi:hypothetical protein
MMKDRVLSLRQPTGVIMQIFLSALFEKVIDCALNAISYFTGGESLKSYLVQILMQIKGLILFRSQNNNNLQPIHTTFTAPSI